MAPPENRVVFNNEADRNIYPENTNFNFWANIIPPLTSSRQQTLQLRISFVSLICNWDNVPSSTRISFITLHDNQEPTTLSSTRVSLQQIDQKAKLLETNDSKANDDKKTDFCPTNSLA